MAKKTRTVKKPVKEFSPSMLVLVIIASVLLSAGIFYTTALVIGGTLPGGGGTLPGGTVVPGAGGTMLTGCGVLNCTACTSIDSCKAVNICTWTTGTAPTGAITASVGGGGTCYKYASATTNAGVSTAGATSISISFPPGQTTGISSVAVETSSATDVSINAKKLLYAPSSVSAPSGTVYSYYEITGTGDITSAAPNFVIPGSWLTTNGFDSSTLKVWRAATGATAFSEVPTTATADGINYIVKGKSTGFSYWAVTGAAGCGGTVSLSIPATAAVGTDVTASLSGLSNCAGKTAYIKADSCSGTTACAAATDATSGSCSFAAPESAGTYTYYACIDKNGDGAFTGAGESDFAAIEVTATAAGNGTGGTEAVCGSGVIETGEDCDGTQLGGQTCTGLGYTGGTLKCTETCTFDTSGCAGTGGGTTPTVTADQALTAINDATATVSAARTEGKDVTSAASLLNTAIAAYNGADYATAKTQADAAKAAALAAAAAKPAELPMLYIAVGVLVIALGGGLFYASKKGMLKMGGKSTKVKAPTSSPA